MDLLTDEPQVDGAVVVEGEGVEVDVCGLGRLHHLAVQKPFYLREACLVSRLPWNTKTDTLQA